MNSFSHPLFWLFLDTTWIHLHIYVFNLAREKWKVCLRKDYYMMKRLLSLTQRRGHIFLLTLHCDRSIFRGIFSTSLTRLIRATSQRGATGFCSDCSLLLSDFQSESVCRISCHYIIFLTPSNFLPVLNSRNLFPLSPFILRHRCDIMFRNLQLTCCQRSIWNTVTWVQILDESVCISHSAKAFGKDMNPFRFPIHAIHFRCQLVYTGGITCLEIHD